MAKKTTAGAPPRPSNAFMIFRSEQYRRYLEEGMPQSSISQIVSNDWRSMNRTQQDPWFQKAQVLKAQHLLMYPDYKYNPKSKEQKAAEKAASKLQKAQEVEQRRAAKRAKTSKSTFIPNPNQVTYTQAAAQAVAPAINVQTASPAAATGPPSPSANEAPADSPPSSPLPLQAPQEAHALFAPFPAQMLQQPQQQQWLDPALDPSTAAPSYFDGFPHLKRTFDEMNEDQGLAPVEDAFADIPLDPIPMSHQELSELDDLVQSIVLGYPIAPHSQMILQEGRSLDQVVQPTVAQVPRHAFSADPLADNQFRMGLDGGLPIDANGGNIWNGDSTSFDPNLLDMFTFGEDMNASFQPDVLLPPHFAHTPSTLAPTDESQMDMSYIDYSSCAPMPDNQQPVASTSSAPIATFQQQDFYYPPASSSNASRRRVGGEWPEFIHGNPSRNSSLSQLEAASSLSQLEAYPGPY